MTQANLPDPQFIQKWQKSIKLASLMCEFAEQQLEEGNILESRFTLTVQIEKIKKENFHNCPHHIESQRSQIEKRFHEKLSEIKQISKRKSSHKESSAKKERKSTQDEQSSDSK